MGEVIFLLILAASGILFYVESLGFLTSKLDNSGGPALFPRILILFLIFFIVVRVIAILFNKKEAGFSVKEILHKNRLFFITALVLLVALIKSLGYIPVVSLFLLAVVNVSYLSSGDGALRKSRIVILNAALVVGVVVLYFFFADVVHIQLPPGILKGVL